MPPVFFAIALCSLASVVPFFVETASAPWQAAQLAAYRSAACADAADGEFDDVAVDVGAAPLSAVVPPPLLPHPATVTAATAANEKRTAFIDDFIISPLSVVAPVWTLENRDLVSSDRYFGDPAVSVRPLGFPSHPHGWFSIVVYLLMQEEPAA